MAAVEAGSTQQAHLQLGDALRARVPAAVLSAGSRAACPPPTPALAACIGTLLFAACVATGACRLYKPGHPCEPLCRTGLCCLQAGAGERLVIIDFFAPWCAACKVLYPKASWLPLPWSRLLALQHNSGAWVGAW